MLLGGLEEGVVSAALIASDLVGAVGHDHLCIAVQVDGDKIFCVAGDLTLYECRRSDFTPNSVCAPEFQALGILDWGQTIAFGDYQAAFDAIRSFGINRGKVSPKCDSCDRPTRG